MKEFITKENKAALEAELHELTTVKRKQIVRLAYCSPFFIDNQITTIN